MYLEPQLVSPRSVTVTATPLPSKFRLSLHEVVAPLRHEPDDGEPLLSQRYITILLQRGHGVLREQFVEALRDAHAREDDLSKGFLKWMIDYRDPVAEPRGFAAWLRQIGQAEHATALGSVFTEARESFVAEEEGWAPLVAPYDDLRGMTMSPEGALGSELLLRLATLCSPHLDDAHFDGPDPWAEEQPEEESFDAYLDGQRYRVSVTTTDGLADVHAALDLIHHLLKVRGVDLRLLLLQDDEWWSVLSGPSSRVREALRDKAVELDPRFAAGMPSR